MLAGPAEFPLAAVVLDYDAATDELTASGFVGSALFEKFFAAQKSDLIAEFGRGGYRTAIEGQVVVMPLADFSGNIVHC